MIRRARVAGAVLGTIVAAAPLVTIERTNSEWLAAMAASARTRPPPSDVAIVWIDATAVAHPAFAAHPRAAWSMPLARVVAALLEAGASVIAVDLVLVRDDMLDFEWLRTLRKGARDGRVILGGTAGAWPSRRQLAAIGLASVASVVLPRDADGVVRTVPLAIAGRASLAAAAAARSGAPTSAAVPLAAPGLPRFTSWSAAEVIDCGSPRLVEAFAGRTVFIGADLQFEDRHRSPLRSLPAATRTVEVSSCTGTVASVVLDDPVPGVSLHALAADAWLHGRITHAPPRSSVLLMIVAVAAAASIRGRWTALALVVATPLAVAAYAHGWVTPWLPLAVAAVGAATTRFGFETADGAWRFAVSLPRRFRSRPQHAEVTVLTACFIDIEAFTRSSESTRDPSSTARDLGLALRSLADIVERHGGFVDKYIGDAMLVLFGCEGEGDGRAEAVSAALACIGACDGGRRLRIGGRPIRVRIGLACGSAHLGPVGDGARLHFTAIGDVVNIAARLESMNRELGTRVLADSGVASVVAPGCRRDLGPRSLRGRRDPVRVFDLTPI